MEALFQIGKELGSLTARVSALETKGPCNCGPKNKGTPLSELSDKEREITLKLRKNHKKLFAGINGLLKQYGLADQIRVSTVRFVGADVPRVIGAGTDDCCFCCQNEGVSGPDYCCSDNCEPCCAG